MKTLAVLLFTLSLYLLPNPTHSTRNPIRLPTADVTASQTPVLDIDGEELRAGGTYNILSANRAYGGVKLAHLDRTMVCPTDVIMANVLDYGDPIIITPEALGATVVFTSTNQSFSFIPVKENCADQVSWEVRYGLYPNGVVKALDVVSYKFKIERVSSESFNSYQIIYCPFDECRNIGVYYDPSTWETRLAPSENPFTVVFKKSGVV